MTRLLSYFYHKPTGTYVFLRDLNSDPWDVIPILEFNGKLWAPVREDMHLRICVYNTGSQELNYPVKVGKILVIKNMHTLAPGEFFFFDKLSIAKSGGL